jgi:hypothetical protein
MDSPSSTEFLFTTFPRTCKSVLMLYVDVPGDNVCVFPTLIKENAESVGTRVSGLGRL